MKLTRPLLLSVLEDSTFEEFKEEGTLEAVRINNNEAITLNVVAGDMNGVLIEKCTLTGSQFLRLSGRDVIIRTSDVSGVSMSAATLNRMEFADCRMSGFDASRIELRDAVFRGCKLDMANFRFANLRRVRFIDCQLMEADFLGCSLHDVKFEQCTLERTVFEKAVCKRVDLRTSELTDLSGWTSLKGATIDGVQLSAASPYLAHALGLTVSNE